MPAGGLAAPAIAAGIAAAISLAGGGAAAAAGATGFLATAGGSYAGAHMARRIGERFAEYASLSHRRRRSSHMPFGQSRSSRLPCWVHAVPHRTLCTDMVVVHLPI